MITQAGEYALRAMVYLAQTDPQTHSSAGAIAVATRVPQAYLQKILRVLTREHLLVAQRGVGGGFALAKLASAIRILDVLKACDSAPVRIEICPLGIEGHTQLCALHKLLDQQLARVEQVFASTTIADLVMNQTSPLCDFNSKHLIQIRNECTKNDEMGESS